MKKRKPKERIYVCHTYYHVYVACLKELTLPRAMRGKADLVLSTMSNDFGSLKERAEKSGLFEAVFMFEEKEEQKASWIALLKLTRDVLEKCIDVLGFSAPERM